MIRSTSEASGTLFLRKLDSSSHCGPKPYSVSGGSGRV
jgi:hypothetical protein